uniref:Uncharacterized protein n=1 Tax=Plectus sambesii TaxID=2011161 RepID=A0A914UK15_9BILA
MASDRHWWRRRGPGPAAATKPGAARGGQLPFGIGLLPSYARGQAAGVLAGAKKICKCGNATNKIQYGPVEFGAVRRDRLTADQREWRNLIQWCTSEVDARRPLVNTPEPPTPPPMPPSKTSITWSAAIDKAKHPPIRPDSPPSRPDYGGASLRPITHGSTDRREAGGKIKQPRRPSPTDTNKQGGRLLALTKPQPTTPLLINQRSVALGGKFH